MSKLQATHMRAINKRRKAILCVCVCVRVYIYVCMYVCKPTSQLNLGAAHAHANFICLILYNLSTSTHTQMHHILVQGCANVVTFNVTVQATPPPQASSVFPQSVSSDASANMAITIMYLAPSTRLQDVSLELSSGGHVVSNLSAVSLVRLSPSSCIHRDCSRFQLNIQTPPSNPAGISSGGPAIVMITAAGLRVNASFVYRAQGSPSLESYSPRSILTTAVSAGAATVTFYARNILPSCRSPACQDEVASGGIRVLFGSMTGTLVPGSISALNGLLAFSVVAPTSAHAQTVQGSITSTNTSSAQEPLPFDFAYTAPPALAAPSQGVMTGGDVVRITAYGWSAQTVASVTQASSVVVTVCGTTAAVQSVLAAVYSTNESYVQVSVRMPACSTVGTRSGTITAAADTSASAPLSFVYFKAPTITLATPNRATLDGRTTASDGVSTVLRVADLPSVQAGAAAGLAVTFAGVNCDGGARTCSVTNIVNSIGYVDVTVKVPAATAEGLQPVRITSGGRTAESVFEYFAPAPEIRSVSYCPVCR